MKYFYIALCILFLFSCERKTEFFTSSPSGNLILIKNSPNDDIILKKIIKNFIAKNYNKYKPHITYFSFYRYNNNTKYFLKNREDLGWFSSEDLNDYPEDEIANFIINKCKNDTTKKVGFFIFYGIRGSEKSEIIKDTIIYNCK